MQRYTPADILHAADQAREMAEVLQRLASMNVDFIPQEVRPRLLATLAEIRELSTT